MGQAACCCSKSTGEPGQAPQSVYANDGAPGDSFGSSLSIRGQQLVVGAPRASVAGKTNAGAVYVFNVSPFFTSQTARLVAADAKAGDIFGSSVDIEGNYVIAGAPGQSRAGLQDGAAYVFPASPNWSQQATFTLPDNPNFLTAYGSKVALSGNFAVIASDYSGGYGGRFQVYRRIDTSWLRQGSLGSPFNPDPRFPALSYSGTTVLAGLPVSNMAAVYQAGEVPLHQEIAVYSGSGPNLREAPAGQPLHLGEAWINQAQEWNFTIHNEGNTTLQLNMAELTPGADAGITVDPLGIFGSSQIQPGEVGYITVRTTFASEGNKTGTLRISSNDSDEAVYRIPMNFKAIPRPAPEGLKIRLKNGAAIITYPRFQFFSFQVERSSSLNAWQPLGSMTAEFDPTLQTFVMVLRDFSPPPGKAYYRVKVN